MTQEQKELLLKDLCNRLPYGVMCNIGLKHPLQLQRIFVDRLDGILLDFYEDSNNYQMYLSEVKPYLLPLSSMTEEQKYDFYCRFIENDCDFDDFKEFYLDNGMWHKLITSLDDIDAIIDWFNENLFDYRGLIPMGLANDATGLNIY